MKYNVKVFDDERLMLSAVVPIEDISCFIEPYIYKFSVKVYMLTDDE